MLWLPCDWEVAIFSGFLIKSIPHSTLFPPSCPDMVTSGSKTVLHKPASNKPIILSLFSPHSSVRPHKTDRPSVNTHSYRQIVCTLSWPPFGLYLVTKGPIQEEGRQWLSRKQQVCSQVWFLSLCVAHPPCPHRIATERHIYLMYSTESIIVSVSKVIQAIKYLIQSVNWCIPSAAVSERLSAQCTGALWSVSATINNHINTETTV